MPVFLNLHIFHLFHQNNSDFFQSRFASRSELTIVHDLKLVEDVEKTSEMSNDDLSDIDVLKKSVNVANSVFVCSDTFNAASLALGSTIEVTKIKFNFCVCHGL